MKPNLTHIALHVADLQACITFYQKYCQLNIIHERHASKDIVWMAEKGREQELILVLMSDGPKRNAVDQGYGHLGFAVESKARVDQLALQGKEDGILVWPPREEPYPVGYYCGVVDPNGNFIEFSYGQPLGPGAKPIDEEPCFTTFINQS